MSHSLRALLEQLPPETLIPVGWALEQLDGAGEGIVDLTVPDVAEALGRAPSTVRQWCADGRLPGAYRLHGREWRIPRSSLARLRDQHDVQGAAPVDLGAWRRVAGG